MHLENLTGNAAIAAKAILSVMDKHGEFPSENPFQLPSENMGKGSELVVVYDGSDLKKFMSLDGFQYDLVEEVQAALEKVGMFFEEYTTWYGAVYLTR